MAESHLWVWNGHPLGLDSWPSCRAWWNVRDALGPAPCWQVRPSLLKRHLPAGEVWPLGWSPLMPRPISQPVDGGVGYGDGGHLGGERHWGWGGGRGVGVELRLHVPGVAAHRHGDRAVGGAQRRSGKDLWEGFINRPPSSSPSAVTEGRQRRA